MDKVMFAYVSGCNFYTDGTYRRSGGEISWWKRDEKGVAVRHHEDDEWEYLDTDDSSERDKRHEKELIQAIDQYMEEQLLEESDEQNGRL